MCLPPEAPPKIDGLELVVSVFVGSSVLPFFKCELFAAFFFAIFVLEIGLPGGPSCLIYTHLYKAKSNIS